jgi:hypothetical protein
MSAFSDTSEGPSSKKQPCSGKNKRGATDWNSMPIVQGEEPKTKSQKLDTTNQDEQVPSSSSGMSIQHTLDDILFKQQVSIRGSIGRMLQGNAIYRSSNVREGVGI